MRDGQWCVWNADVPGAHKARNGKVVGVFHLGRRARLSEEKSVELPDLVIPVNAIGEGIPAGQGLGNLSFFPKDCRDLEPVTDKRDIPEARLKGVPDTWQPRP